MMALNKIMIRDSGITYLDEGQGEGSPIVFLHGIGTSSYLWRNVIPDLAKHTRCVAPDLIGMGDSDKPDIKYDLFDHIEYFDAFMQQMNLKNVILVMHGLGSAIGFDYAMRNSANIKGLAFYEAHVRPVDKWDGFSLLVQDILHPMVNNPDYGYKKVVEENFIVEKILPAGAMRKFTEEEMDNYRRPFALPQHRMPIWQYLQDFMMGESNAKVKNRISDYSQWLCQSSLPKLLFFATPGFFTTMDTVKWCADNLSNLHIVDLEEGLHLAQESNPKLFSTLLRDWYIKIG